MKMMITNYGPHPADKWADATADAILALIEVSEDSVSDAASAARQAKRDLRPVLFNLFNDHHIGIQSAERFKLDTIKEHKQACAHCDKPLGLHDEVPATLAELNTILSVTPFAAHFAQEHVQEVLQTIIGQHTADVQHIERRWHVDKLAAAKGA